MEKLGMRFEKNATYYNLNVVQYGITRDEFTPAESCYVVLPE